MADTGVRLRRDEGASAIAVDRAIEGSYDPAPRRPAIRVRAKPAVRKVKLSITVSEECAERLRVAALMTKIPVGAYVERTIEPSLRGWRMPSIIAPANRSELPSPAEPSAA